MKIPPGMTETEVLSVIDNVAHKLCSRFIFGYHSWEDIFQEARIIGLDGLERYNQESGPLENFLSVHIKNRLSTFKRDNFIRMVPRGLSHDELREWRNKYAPKIFLMEPLDISNIDDSEESSMWTTIDFITDIEIGEILSLIDQYMDVGLRADYLRMLDDVDIPRHRKLKIEQFIAEILEEYGYETRQAISVG